MTEIDALIQGSIDMHIHAGPDSMPHRVDALEAAMQAKQVGMSAIVLKNHFYATAPLAMIVSQLVPEVKVFGSICLNYEVGGLNFFAVEAACILGARILWMPTLSSANSRSRMSKLFNIQLEGQGFSLLDGNDKLVPEMKAILTLVKKYNMIMASGHISPKETFTLLDEAKKVGIHKLVITHANSIEIVEQALSFEQQKSLASQGAFIEYVGVNLMPNSFRHDPAEMVEAIKTIGAHNFIMSTDMGPATDPPPVEGMRIFVSTLLSNGLSKEEIELMIKINPAKLLEI